MRNKILLLVVGIVFSLSSYGQTTVDCGVACIGQTVTFDASCTSTDPVLSPTDFTYNPVPGVTLNANGTGSFFIDPAIYTSADVGLIVSYAITCVCPDGCESTVVLEVEISDGPQLDCQAQLTPGTWSSIEGQNCEVTICTGESIAIGVGPPPAGFTYSWVTPIGNFTSANILVSASGTYTLTVTENATGCTQELVFTVKEKVITQKEICPN